MSPFERMTEKFGKAGFGDRFVPDLWLHLTHGYVVSTPDAFAMARPVWSHWGSAEMADITLTAPEGDCWHIWALSGDLGEAVRWLPCSKKWLAFARRGHPKLVQWDTIRHAITRQFSRNQGASRSPKAIGAAVQGPDGVHEEASRDGWELRGSEDASSLSPQLGKP